MRAQVELANAETLARSFSALEEPSENPEAGLANVIRLSENDRIIYELQPGMRARTFRGSLVSTDELGFRVGPPVPRDERPLFTIIGLGDSIQFGHGVNDGETYLYRLQKLLQAAHPERRWRVINSGVPGYNTVMEVETLRAKCLELAPDLVILNLVSNDYAPPYFVRNEIDPWALDHSFLFDQLIECVGEESVEASGRWREGGRAVLGDGREWYERDADGRPKVPEAHRDVFGPEAFERALSDLRSLAQERGFELLCFTTYEWGKIAPMVRSARERGFLHSTLMPELREQLRAELGAEFSEKAYRNSSLVVSRENAHPSARQHNMAAHALLRDLERFGLLAPR